MGRREGGSDLDLKDGWNWMRADLRRGGVGRGGIDQKGMADWGFCLG